MVFALLVCLIALPIAHLGAGPQLFQAAAAMALIGRAGVHHTRQSSVIRVLPTVLLSAGAFLKMYTHAYDDLYCITVFCLWCQLSPSLQAHLLIVCNQSESNTPVSEFVVPFS